MSRMNPSGPAPSSVRERVGSEIERELIVPDFPSEVPQNPVAIVPIEVSQKTRDRLQGAISAASEFQDRRIQPLCHPSWGYYEDKC